MKATQVTAINYKAKLRPAKHTIKKWYDQTDIDLAIALLLALTIIGYFGYGLFFR